MDRLKRIPVSAALLAAVLVGFLCAIHGLYLLVELVWQGAGAGVTLLVGGVVVMAVALVADVG